MTTTRNTTRAARFGMAAMFALALLTGFNTATASAQQDGSSQDSAEQAPVRNVSEWNIKKNKLAIKGYDPVAYFKEGGGKAKKGKKDFAYTHKGVTYRFLNESNRERFKANPNRYEPAHGGWCSYAMAQGGGKTAPDPKNFIVKDDRLFLFYKGLGGDTKKSWQRGDHATQANDADQAWKRVSGEDARKVPVRVDEDQ